MKILVISLFALLLLSESACTRVYVSVRQHVSNSNNGLTGTQCKLQRDLRNQDQKTNVWCWAASAHTVIEYLRNEPNNPIDQCNLVQAVYQGQLTYDWVTYDWAEYQTAPRWAAYRKTPPPPEDLDPPNCCMKMPEDELPAHAPNVDIAQQDCYQNGWPEYVFFTKQFRTQFEAYEYDWTIPYPNGLSWDEIVEEICADRPMISVILYARKLGGGGHAVVIGGYNELEDGSQWVHVYDPGYNTMEEDYYLWSYDAYLGDPGVFTHVRDYKKISVQ